MMQAATILTRAGVHQPAFFYQPASDLVRQTVAFLYVDASPRISMVAGTVAT